MKENAGVICFTGHRDIPVSHFKKLYTLLPSLLEDYIFEGYTVFRAGGALGFDMLCEVAVLELKKAYPDIRLQLILPYREQAEKWDPADADIYNAILREADEVTYVAEKYSPSCLPLRNRTLVEGSDLCIAYLGDDKGGTKYTVGHANTKGVRVVNLYRLVCEDGDTICGSDTDDNN